MGDIRSRLFADDLDAATTLIDFAAAESGYSSDLVWTDPLGPASTLVIDSSDSSAQPADYTRYGRYDTGEVSVAWSEDGARRSITVVPVRDSSAMLVELRSESAWPVVVSLSKTPPGADSRAKERADRTPFVVNSNSNAVIGTLSVPSRYPLSVATAFAIPDRAHDSTVVSAVVQAGSPVYVRIAMAVGPDPKATAEEARKRLGHLLQAQPADLLHRQRVLHSLLTGTSRLTLGSAVDKRPDDAEGLFGAARAGDPDATLAAIEATYAAGRNIIVSSTGRLPPTLQGVWQGSWTPAWSSDYTMNGNLQNGALAAAAVTGTPELVESILRLIEPHSADFADNARRIFDADGWMIPARMTTHGIANHFNAAYPHQIWIGCGPWLLRLLWDAALMAGSESAAARLWPTAERVASFLVTALTARDGTVHFAPSYSPENTPLERPSAVAIDATSDIAMARDGLSIAAELADLAGHQRRAQEWRTIARQLPPYRIEGGNLAEWIESETLDNVEHRHASHLYGLWYENDPTLDKAGKMAAREAVRRRLKWREAVWAQDQSSEMAFGLAQLGLAAASLGDSRIAVRCAELLALEHWGENMVSTHDAGRIFNVDACGSLPSVVVGMLVQSNRDRIALLPALPSRWRSGSLTGILTRAGWTVEVLRWEGGSASALLSTSGRVRRPASPAIDWPAGWQQDSLVTEADECGSLRVTVTASTTIR